MYKEDHDYRFNYASRKVRMSFVMLVVFFVTILAPFYCVWGLFKGLIAAPLYLMTQVIDLITVNWRDEVES